MHANDLKTVLAERLDFLRTGICNLLRFRWNETRSLLFEFPDRPGALDLASERMVVARMLRKSNLCRRALTLDECTIRVEGVSIRRITDMISEAGKHGANQCSVLA
ncbi:MAG: hypothetical protein CMJ24_00405 [Phycisphaerae bacterium]|nr:hypothetical protein [Phycisphaerae bacterium]